MSQNGDIAEKVVESTNVAKVREVIARPRKVGSGAPGALRGRCELVLAPRVLQRALPDVAALLKDSTTSALGPRKETAHELAQATKKRVYEDKRQNAVQPDSGLKPHDTRDVAFIVQNNNETEPTSTVDSPTANDEETVSQDSVTVKVEPEERCFDEGVTEAIGVDYLEYQIKDELLRDERCFEECVSPEAAEIDLYKDHQIKDELVLGPVLLQPRDVAFIVQNNNEKEPTSCATHKHSILQRHEKEHTSNKPFKCSYCAYATHQYCILQEHEKLHMSNKPFKCSYCNYTARYKSSLTKHELKHSFKRVKCSHCDYTTRYKAHVTRHELRHHSHK